MNRSIAEEKIDINQLTSNTDSVRVSFATAQEILFENRNRLIKGFIRSYQIMELGLGVYEVRLRPLQKPVSTVMVKELEV